MLEAALKQTDTNIQISQPPTSAVAPTKEQIIKDAVSAIQPAQIESKTDSTPVKDIKKEEPKAEVKPEEPKESMSKKFAYLAKEDKKIREGRAALKKEAQELRGIKEAKANAKLDPIKYLEEAGVNYDQVVDFLLNNKKPTGNMVANDRLSKLEQTVEKVISEKQELEQKLTQKELNSMYSQELKNIETKLNAAEGYDYVKSLGNPELIYQVMLEHYNNTKSRGEPKLLTFEEAFEASNKYLESEITSVLKSLKEKSPSKLELLLKSLNGEAPTKPTPPSVKSESTTLTNEQQQNGSQTVKRPLTREEVLREAAKLIRINP